MAMVFSKKSTSGSQSSKKKVRPSEIPPLKIISEDTASTAAGAIKSIDGGRLPQEIIDSMLIYFGEDLKDSMIQKRIAKRYGRELSPATIKRYRDKYAGRIREIVAERDKFALSAGLSRKTNRILKLEKLANAIEENLFEEDGETLKSTANGKMIAEYREMLKMLGVEVGDIDIAGGDVNFIGMSDSDLAKQVADVVSHNPDLAVIISEKAGVRPTVPDAMRQED
jgi:hypothetical protein